MAANIWWYDDPDAWDQCWIGVLLLPGVARVDVAREQLLDVKTAAGQVGATVTNQGIRPAKVTISLIFWTADHLAVFGDICRQIETLDPKNGRKPQSYSITHPATLARKVLGVMIQGITGPREGSVKGTREATIDCLEQRPPLKVPVFSPKLNIASRNLQPSIPPVAPSVATPPKP